MATIRAVIAFTILLGYTQAEVYSDHVTSPIMLYRGDFIESMSKNSKLVMQQADGNLVLYNTTNSPSIAVWSSNTIDATYTEITSDGNITVKDDNGRIYWSSNSGGHNASEYYLVVMDFCAYLMDPHYTVLWSTCEDACNVRYPTFAPPTSKGDTPVHVPTAQPTHPPTVTHLNHIVIAQNSSFILQASDERIYSLSMTTFFIMQRDGNALLYVIKDGCQQDWVFKTRTDRTGAEYMEFKSDGNIIVTDRNHTIYWQSNSGGYLASAPHRFVVIDECAYLANRYDHILYIIGNCNCSDTAFDPPTMAIGSPTGAPTPKPTPIYMDHASTSTNNSFFLYPFDRIASRSLNTFATFQSDGNFVLYVDEGCRHKAIWSTNTQNKDAKYVVLMRNGNLKVMGKNGTVLFTSDTYENGRPQPQHLVVTDECMYLMDGDYTMYWHQGSGCAVFNGTFPTFSAPTAEPSPTKQPTTIQPTLSPTVYPTITPTLPTSEPTKITIFPTIFPTQIPTTIPTKVPTKSTSDPTKIPTNAPITAKPTDITTFPTVFQTQNPTKTPTKVPIKLTADPTNTLTNAPITDDPTMFVIISSTYKATESDQEEDVHKEENLYFEYLMDENIIQIYDEKDWQNYQQDVKTFKQRVLHCKNMQFPSPQKVTSTQNAVCANSHHAISQQPSPHNLFSATAPLTPALEAIHEQQSMGFWQRNQNQNPQHSLMDELPIAGSGSNAVSGLLSTGSAKMQNPVQKEMKLDEYCMKKDPYNTCFDMMTKRTSNL
eukprot:631900_1